jgi:hypothetical protein
MIFLDSILDYFLRKSQYTGFNSKTLTFMSKQTTNISRYSSEKSILRILVLNISIVSVNYFLLKLTKCIRVPAATQNKEANFIYKY